MSDIEKIIADSTRIGALPIIGDTKRNRRYHCGSLYFLSVSSYFISLGIESSFFFSDFSFQIDPNFVFHRNTLSYNCLSL